MRLLNALEERVRGGVPSARHERLHPGLHLWIEKGHGIIYVALIQTPTPPLTLQQRSCHAMGARQLVSSGVKKTYTEYVH